MQLYRNFEALHCISGYSVSVLFARVVNNELSPPRNHKTNPPPFLPVYNRQSGDGLAHTSMCYKTSAKLSSECAVSTVRATQDSSRVTRAHCTCEAIYGRRGRTPEWNFGNTLCGRQKKSRPPPPPSPVLAVSYSHNCTFRGGGWAQTPPWSLTKCSFSCFFGTGRGFNIIVCMRVELNRCS